jgi:hypothetical protein
MADKGNTEGKGPKYFINIGGTEYPWSKDTITVAEIRGLAGWDVSQPVVEVNLKDKSKTTLGDDASIAIKPGHGFSKKIEFDSGSVKPSGAWAQ